MIRRSVLHDTKGSTTVEFAIVGWLFCLVIFAIIETGLLWWAKSGMQVTAAMTARCAAIGYSYNTSNCYSAATTQAYAVTMARTWVFQNLITASDVTVSPSVTTCNGMAGKFVLVSIQSTALRWLPPPLGNMTLNTSACYPMP